MTAFYVTSLFKLERVILKWAVSKPRRIFRFDNWPKEKPTRLPHGTSRDGVKTSC